MNLDVFNKVNLKTNVEGYGMYGEWTSLSSQIQNNADDGTSVLKLLGNGVGKDLVAQIVRQLSSNLGITQPGEPSALKTDKDVSWYMEIICYGLTLPLTEHDTLRDCVNIYCEWLSALDNQAKISVPKAILEDPNLYGRKIINHFQNVFTPRKNEGIDASNRQAVLCHRVLRTLQNLAHTSSKMDRNTWETLLLFLISVNSVLLSPPGLKDDVGDQLSERVLGVLFEIWLLACTKSFPTPPLWKTFTENCLQWRHHIALVEQWNRINYALTSRLLSFLYGSTFPELKINDDDLSAILNDMSNDAIAQSWFRFLHCIGNPVYLARPSVISQTDKFLQYAIDSEGTMDPSRHPCLNNLPVIFYKAIKGVSGLVDSLLGIARNDFPEDLSLLFNYWDLKTSHKDPQRASLMDSHKTITPPAQRRLAKSFSVTSSSTKSTPKTSLPSFAARIGAQSTTSLNSGPPSTASLTSLSSHVDWRNNLSPNRPKCDSILHLFGKWLFDAALIGHETYPGFQTYDEMSKRSSTIIDEHHSLSSTSSDYSSIALNPDNYELGKAEAIGTLCRLFSAKKTGETIRTVYLARFYAALKFGIKTNQQRECNETMAAILLNSSDLFKLNLDGLHVLLPSFISALEVVLADKDLKLRTQSISRNDLRRASINILLSILPLPLHYQNVSIRELLTYEHTTFLQLKPRLMNLLINSLQVETDTYNTHMLLGALLLLVQDFHAYESNLERDSDSGSVACSSTASDISIVAPVADSAHALFVRATYLVCHKLISTWKTDLNVSLSALELLMGLARMNIKESEILECKRTVKWLCDYIIYQCWRPPPAHSKDLHSTIVAAFHCCSVWLVAHPYLLQDKDCLNTALEVVELGISGTKSTGKPGDPLCPKDEKELKPASLRVKEAAEHLLQTIMEQVSYFPSECGSESLSSLLNEISLLRHCNLWPGKDATNDKAIQQFRYFAVDNSMILALLEESLGNDQDSQPTVTVIIRGTFGRYVWTMQLRHLPRHKSGTTVKYHSTSLGRPVAMSDPPVQPHVNQYYFPETIESLPKFKIDTYIPTLDDVIPAEEQAEFEQFQQLIQRQSALEQAFLKTDTDDNQPATECAPPEICHEFQTARLFLSHFGFISYDDEDDDVARTLTALDSKMTSFWTDIESLDRTSARTFNTAHVFYVGAGQHTAEEVVANVTDKSKVSQAFTVFLTSLGWSVDVTCHPGWTGNVATSWNCDVKRKSGDDAGKAGQKEACSFDGEKHVIYWADANAEMAFVVPSKVNEETDAFCDVSKGLWHEHETLKSQSSLEFDPHGSVEMRRRNPSKTHHQQHVDCKIIIAWLENYEDHLYLQIDDLLTCTKTGVETAQPKSQDTYIIYLHELKSGLLRVKMKGPAGRINLATPLVDGMVVPNKIAGSLVRETALNIARRKRLEYDMYQPPHVRRRFKIQEIVKMYAKASDQSQLLSSLF